MEKNKKTGLLVMAYGTPYKKEDIEPYYTAIRHGRKPSQAQIDNLAQRYAAIGGSSPLARLTQEQADALEKVLNENQQDRQFKSYLGLKYIHPYIEDAVQQMYADGIEQCIALVLAPHYSRFSVQSYTDRAKSAASKNGGPAIYSIESWYQQPEFIHFWANRVIETINSLPDEEKEKSVVIFSAHSLPQKILKNGDPYPDQVTETAQAIAKQSGISHYVQAWQSAGKTSDPWLGPDVLDKIGELAEMGKYKHYIFCPIGFVAEHLEVLYDNDQQCRKLVESLGGVYHRPTMPDADPLFIKGLAGAVMKAVQQEVPSDHD
ncbi:MAG: ferrochelatase [Sporolactobacillus sp.]